MITNETIIKAAKAAGLADMKPVAYLRWEDGVPLWSEDCVCKDDVYTKNGDDDSFGMPIYSADQVSALIQRNAELEARVGELEAQAEMDSEQINSLIKKVPPRPDEQPRKARFA